MADKEIPRSIRFPESLWNAIDRDASKHKRSSVKHLEFLLTAYYKGPAPQIDVRRFKELSYEPDDSVELFVNQLQDLGLLDQFDAHSEGFAGVSKAEIKADISKAIIRTLRKKKN